MAIQNVQGGPAVYIPPVGGDEPIFGGADTLVWSDDFDRYGTLFDQYGSTIPMYCDGNCGVGTAGFGIPSGTASYGRRTMPNESNGCVVDTGITLIPGRSGTGRALRGFIQATDGSESGFSWLSPWGFGSSYAYTAGAPLAMQIWFRISAGGQPSTIGCKFFVFQFSSEVYNHNSVHWDTIAGQSRYYFHLGPHGRTGADGGGATATQPVAPWYSDVNDGNWHRLTELYKRNSVNGARDGYWRVWIDGTKIIDCSNTAAGVTPPGGIKPWCQLTEVDNLDGSQNIIFNQFVSVYNTGPGRTAHTVDHDDFIVWQENG
jgi:hypothetical protein